MMYQLKKQMKEQSVKKACPPKADYGLLCLRFVTGHLRADICTSFLNIRDHAGR